MKNKKLLNHLISEYIKAYLDYRSFDKEKCQTYKNQSQAFSMGMMTAYEKSISVLLKVDDFTTLQKPLEQLGKIKLAIKNKDYEFINKISQKLYEKNYFIVDLQYVSHKNCLIGTLNDEPIKKSFDEIADELDDYLTTDPAGLLSELQAM